MDIHEFKRDAARARISARAFPPQRNGAPARLLLSLWGGLGSARAARRQLDDFAEQVRQRLSPDASLRERASAVSTVLFDSAGLCGNQGRYYDDANSFLSEARNFSSHFVF